jgi:hypothetical protein
MAKVRQSTPEASGARQIAGCGSCGRFSAQSLTLVLGVRPRLDDLAHGPFRGPSSRVTFWFLFLRLFRFAVTMLFAVCHDRDL